MNDGEKIFNFEFKKCLLTDDSDLLNENQSFLVEYKNLC